MGLRCQGRSAFSYGVDSDGVMMRPGYYPFKLYKDHQVSKRGGTSYNFKPQALSSLNVFPSHSMLSLIFSRYGMGVI